MSRIVSIQSHVAYGHVGNAAVTFPLQLLGHQVWPVPTAVLSNHAGYPGTGGAKLDPVTLAGILSGLEARGVPEMCDLLLTGYLGTRVGAEAVEAFAATARRANPASLRCCDPVMGDRDTGFYVEEGLQAYFRDIALPHCDVLTPNLFELEAICALAEGELHAGGEGAVVDAARGTVARMRPGAVVLVTSVETSETSAQGIAMLAVDARAAWRVETPRLAFTRAPHGAGDLAGALFSAALASGIAPDAALSGTAARLHAVLSRAAAADDAEMDLVGSAPDLRDPPCHFDAKRTD